MLIASEVIAILHEILDLATGGGGLRADLHAKIDRLDGTTPASPPVEQPPAPQPPPDAPAAPPFGTEF